MGNKAETQSTINNKPREVLPNAGWRLTHFVTKTQIALNGSLLLFSLYNVPASNFLFGNCFGDLTKFGWLFVKFGFMVYEIEIGQLRVSFVFLLLYNTCTTLYNAYNFLICFFFCLFKSFYSLIAFYELSCHPRCNHEC